MTPADLANRYTQLRQRVAMHITAACEEVSVPLPADFSGELAFYRLVNWSFIVLNEAARQPLAFLMALPPLRANADLRTEVGRMRTFVAHNLDVTSSNDLKTRSFAHSWFRSACGVGSPLNDEQFSKCSEYLANRIDNALQGAIIACDALDHAIDGPGLVSNLKGRIDLHWEAYQFDEIVSDIASLLGNPGLDLIELRKTNLDSWRKVLTAADAEKREEALRLRIEATFVSAIADTLPISASEISKRLAISGRQSLSAALIMLRDFRIIEPGGITKLIEEVAGSVLKGTVQ